MDVTRLPFNRYIGLEREEKVDALVSLPGHPQYTNHIGTVHASALLAVAEAGSGEFLARHLAHVDGFVPVVRSVEANFRKPAHGQVTARASLASEIVQSWVDKLKSRGRCSVSIPVEVFDPSGTVVLSAMIEWYIAKANTVATNRTAPVRDD